MNTVQVLTFLGIISLLIVLLFAPLYITGQYVTPSLLVLFDNIIFQFVLIFLLLYVVFSLSTSVSIISSLIVIIIFYMMKMSNTNNENMTNSSTNVVNTVYQQIANRLYNMLYTGQNNIMKVTKRVLSGTTFTPQELAKYNKDVQKKIDQYRLAITKELAKKGVSQERINAVLQQVTNTIKSNPNAQISIQNLNLSSLTANR